MSASGGPLSLSIDAIRPLNRWDFSTIRPGPVGSVGDALVQTRFKHSNPDMPLRFDPSNSHGREPRGGSNVEDGQYISYTSFGGPAKTVDSNWGGRRSFKIRRGWYYQGNYLFLAIFKQIFLIDMRAEDRRVDPIVGSTPQYSWNNKVAQVYNARVTGDLFLPLPGEYVLNPGDIPRGGSKPRPTDEVGGDAEEAPCSYFGPEAPVVDSLSVGGGARRLAPNSNPIPGRTGGIDCSSGYCRRVR